MNEEKSSYSYNSDFLLKNGKPWFPVMGELHYSRYPKKLWPEALAKMKAGGVTIVSSYIFWIHHEEKKGEYDFTGNRDLRGFLHAVQDAGLPVFLRIGPWCHGEVRNGGLPDWIMEKDYEPRTNDKGYLEEVKAYFAVLAEQIRGLLWEDGGPVIGIQIENEYGCCGGLDGEEGEAHMRVLTNLALDAGLKAPYMTATGWGGAHTAGLLPVMGGYCDAPWDRSLEKLPPNGNYVFTPERDDSNIGSDFGKKETARTADGNYPYLTAELGGGLQPTRHRRPVPSASDTGAMSLVKLGCGANLLGYYMYHGGTNPKGKYSSLPQTTDHYYDASLSMSWELDIFGSIRKRVKAQKENFAASKEEYTGVMVSLAAEVASAYINLRELQQELEVVKKNSASQEEVLKITEVRYNTGLVAKLDVAQAKSVLYNTKASIPQLEAGINQYITTLAVLLGMYPQDIRPVLESGGTLPDYMEPIGVGLPVDLLLRRPDVRGAELSVNAQAALLGASKADWLPKVFLKGSFGYAARDLKDLTKSKSMTYEIAPSLSWTIFSGGQLVNATRLAKAQLDEAINQFNQTVLTAVQETDNAMNGYRNSIKQIVALREVRNQGIETLKLSLELYKQGLSPFQNVLDAQRSLLSYENQLVQAQGSSLLQLIALYKALGGGWRE